MSSELSEIKHFYKNQTIFLTGGTGFLGKIILEKLLRECEGLLKVYMLIRPKKNKSSEQRLKELFDLPVSFCSHNFVPEMCLQVFCCTEIQKRRRFEKSLYRQW